MDENKKVLLESQKRAQKKYDQKTKTISIKYTPNDMEDYERLKRYLKSSGKSLNSFVKSLINEYLTNSKTKVDKPLRERLYDRGSYYIFQDVGDEQVQSLTDIFGEDIIKKLINDYGDVIEESVETALIDSGCAFSGWMDTIEEQWADGEYDGKSTDEIYEELVDDMQNNLGYMCYIE